ncbi:MAG: tetratricopeptide repeat protein [Holophagales bacterium]|nr:tetratricopeptide repeat protein [Holophagales bacterium]
MTDDLARWRFAALVAAALVVASRPLALVRDALRKPAPKSVAPAEATFVGRKACAKCHEKATKAWTGSHHDLAMTEATDATVRGDFSGVVFEGDGMKARFFRDGKKFLIETAAPDGKPTVYEAAYTFGWDPLQQYLIKFPGGRMQAFSLAWDVPGKRWFFLYPGRKIPPSDWLHWTRNGQNWNGMCAGCHSTNLVKGFDPRTNTFTTTWFEVDVSCEACHGPGSRHVAWAEVPPMGRSRVDNFGLVLKTSNVTNRELVELCAPCHSRRVELGGYDHRRPELLDNHVPVLLAEGTYHPDGQILDEDFEYGSFVQSKMFRMGVRCTDCHDAHTLKLRKERNGVCLQCHPGTAYDDARHHFHKKEWKGKPSDGALCASCHMPKSPFMVVHMRADHSIRIPRPDLTRDLGVPNSCSLSGCHADKPLSWVTNAFDKWYGTARKPHYGTVLAAGRKGSPAAKADLLRLEADALSPTVVRATALSLLGQYRGPDVTAAFRRALLDEEPLIRRTAVALAPIADEAERVARLAPLLADPFRAVRLEAAAQLAGTPPALLKPYQKDALDTALADYVKAMEYSLDFSYAGHNLGLMYERMHDPVKAEESYRAALAVDDLSYPPKANLAMLLARQGKSAEAEKLLREVLAAYPDRAEVAYALGLLVAEKGALPEAATLLARAAAGMPANARAAYNAGLALAQVGRDAEAEKMLRQAAAADPSSYDLLFALADFLVRKGRLAEVAPLADRMAAIDPARPEAGQLRVILSRMKGLR